MGNEEFTGQASIRAIDRRLLHFMPNSDPKWRLTVAGSILAALCELKGFKVLDEDTKLFLGNYD